MAASAELAGLDESADQVPTVFWGFTAKPRTLLHFPAFACTFAAKLTLIRAARQAHGVVSTASGSSV